MKTYSFSKVTVTSSEPEWLEKNKDLFEKKNATEEKLEPEKPLTVEEKVTKLEEENKLLKRKLDKANKPWYGYEWFVPFNWF